MAEPDATSEREDSFETAIARLEKIVEAMDSRTIPINDLIAHYEEGTRLVKVCETYLNDAEQKIELITRKARGEKPELTAFSPEVKTTDNAPAGPRQDVNLF